MPRVIYDIPVELGTPVYYVYDVCPGIDCPFNGGRGMARCNFILKEGVNRCKSYYEVVPFHLGMQDCIGDFIFLNEKEAAKKVEKLNKKYR